MKILIIDDTPEKLGELKKTVEIYCPNPEITVAESYNRALIFLEDFTFDLIFLDLTLRQFDDDIDSFVQGEDDVGGRDLFFEMVDLGIRSGVIIVSQFETFNPGVEKISLQRVVDQCREVDKNSILLGVVHFQVGMLGPKDRIREIIYRFISSEYEDSDK